MASQTLIQVTGEPAQVRRTCDYVSVKVIERADMTEERAWRFPPFPSKPEGVEIVPFGAFKPVGYRSVVDASGEAIEVDAWAGIRTVKVLDDDEAAKKRKAKKKKRNAGNAVDAAGRLIPWWEEWEEGEALRGMSETSFSQLGFEDRVCLAADDFRVGRTWPEIAQGVRNMWDQFRLYIGLISSIPVYKKIKKKKGQVDGPDGVAVEASDEEEDAPKAKETKVVIVQDYLEQTALPGKQLEPSTDGSTVEAQRLRAFLDDMEKSVKVFLSSYMRDRGLIWTEKNLFITPTVLHFFLRFMLRNGVFVDSKEHLDNLKRAISVAASSRNELPLTAKLGQILPGHFDIACKECWGTKGSMTLHISATIPPAEISDAHETLPSDSSSTFETELKEHDIEVVPSDVVLDSITARQVMEDNLDTDNIVPVTTIPVEGDPWTAATQAEEYTAESWTDVSVPWLMQLLGPTVFPLKMTTGIVEHSTRRIRDVLAPDEISEGTLVVSGVEEVLEKRFYRVVMSPWVGSLSEETVDFPRPVVIPGPSGDFVGGVDIGEETTWNPYRDNVTVLVDGEMRGQLVPGMGLCGTWVQMIPEGEDKRHPRGCYWYIESLVATYPSYYTEGEMDEQPLDDEEDEEDLS